MHHAGGSGLLVGPHHTLQRGKEDSFVIGRADEGSHVCSNVVIDGDTHVFKSKRSLSFISTWIGPNPQRNPDAFSTGAYHLH